MTDIINEELEAAAAVQALLTAAAVTQLDKKRSTAARLEALAVAVTQQDLERLLELQDKMAKAVDTALTNTTEDDTLICTPERLASLMAEHIDFTDISDLLALRYQLRRDRIFAHITAMHEAAGVDDPDHAPGAIPVPEHGRKFTREGGKIKVTLAEGRLAEMLGPERAKRVFQTVVRTETVRDDDALMELVREDPSVLEMVRECVVPGGYTPMSFHVRNLEG